tara:strand:- start:148 stop:477 length:330 start_codon:yes stop_codon:yes gene_type:complete
MYEMELLVFVLSSYGLTQIVVYGKIFDKVRPTQGLLGKLLACSMCTGFWVGVFLWAISNLTSLFMFDSSLVTAFLLGCLSSGTSYVLCQVFGDGGIRYEKMDDPTSPKV